VSPRSPRRARIALVAAAAAALAISLVGAPTASATAAPNVTCTSSTLGAVQSRILTETNAARRSAGAAPLAANAGMHVVAVDWSVKMAAARTMSHNPNYSTQIPPGWRAAGENVAYGYAPASVTRAWLDSPGHRANILNRAYTHIGIGVACSSAGQPYYTQVFGGYTTTPTPSIPRYAGDSRYSTAAAVSRATFPVGVPVAYIADGRNFPDALAGAAAAGSLGGPVLLAAPSGLSAAVKTELTRLKPRQIVVLGGEIAVSEAIVADARNYTTGAVVRVEGANRYSTAAAVSARTFAPGVSAVYLASGTDFPDALSGAAAAGKVNAPVLLTTPGSLPDATRQELARLKPQRIIVLGGTVAVSDAVLNQARSFTTGGVSRVFGANRYETSAAVSKGAYSPGVSVVYLASASAFPDALAGAASAGSLGAPVLLTSPDDLPAVIAAELDRLNPKKIVVLGGAVAVSDEVLFRAQKYVAG